VYAACGSSRHIHTSTTRWHPSDQISSVVDLLSTRGQQHHATAYALPHEHLTVATLDRTTTKWLQHQQPLESGVQFVANAAVGHTSSDRGRTTTTRNLASDIIRRVRRHRRRRRDKIDVWSPGRFDDGRSARPPANGSPIACRWRFVPGM